MPEKNFVFIDTSGFKAVIDPQDEFHQKAAATWQNLASQKAILITSNYVLDEIFTLLRGKCGLHTVLKFKKILSESSPAFKVIRVTMADESKAWDWFIKNWSKLSFTDCVSFAIMKRLEINQVFTFDSHFTRAGFQIV